MEEVIEETIKVYKSLCKIMVDVAVVRNDVRNLEDKLKEVEVENNNNRIKDLEGFKRELDRAGLNSSDLNEFIDNYMRFYNK